MTGSVKSVKRVNRRTGKAEEVKVYFLDGKEVTKAQFDKRFPSKLGEILSGGVEVLTSTRPGCWPMVSRAMGVHPEQVAEGNADLKKAGIDAHYDNSGGLVLKDNATKKRAMKHKGMTDLSSFN